MSACYFDALGESAYQHNQLSISEDHLTKAIQLALACGSERLVFSTRAKLVWTRLAQGAQKQTLQLFEMLERLPSYASTASHLYVARAMQLVLRSGDEERFYAWFHRHHIDKKKLHYMTLYDQLALIHSHVHKGLFEEALALIEPFKVFCERAGIRVVHWELELVQAQILFMQGAKTEACQMVFTVLRQTAPQNVLRLYVDSGETIALILARLPRVLQKRQYDTVAAHVEDILSAFSRKHPSVATAKGDTPTSVATVEPESFLSELSPERYLLDPLSPREIEVLELLSLGMSYKKLAQQLHISLATVKTHTRNIYSKLDVKNRTQAVKRAQILQIAG
tara:strand:- start:1196 stop:2206 length:1011 start_codon:yes stop_codon:yes gene_type:complete